MKNITEGFSDPFYVPRVIAGDFPKNSEVTFSHKKEVTSTGKKQNVEVLKINPGFLQTKTFYEKSDIVKVIDLGDDVRNKGQSTSGTLARAALGGLTFGVGGAVVGGMTGKNEFSEYAVYGIIFKDGKKIKIKFEKDTLIGNQLEQFLYNKIDLGFGDNDADNDSNHNAELARLKKLAGIKSDSKPQQTKPGPVKQQSKSEPVKQQIKQQPKPQSTTQAKPKVEPVKQQPKPSSGGRFAFNPLGR